MNNRKALLLGCSIGLVLVGCICAVAAVGGGAYFAREAVLTLEAEGGFIGIEAQPTLTPAPLVRPDPTEDIGDGGADVPLSSAEQNLETLRNAYVPENDLVALAQRFHGIEDIPATLPDPDAPHEVGDQLQFWVLDTGTNEQEQIAATLRYVTPHVYFWVADGVDVDMDQVRTVTETFENQIYPTNRAFFGSEWSPGIDEDEHIYILYTYGMGTRAAGYFVSIDSVHPLAAEYSNAHEIFMISSMFVPLYGTEIYNVLAHEFQHMIHWYGDGNETSWLNEGFAEVAALLNGYYSGGFEYSFIGDPDLQLTDWPEDNTQPHYGAAFMFLSYFLDRVGEDITKALVKHPANGLESIDIVLAEHNVIDSITQQVLTADALALDWAIANYLGDPDLADGRYGYHTYADAPTAYETETISDCGGNPFLRGVHQYGTDYIRLTCEGQHTLRFTGSVLTELLPVKAYSGEYSFWSNKGDSSDMTLTQLFDFTDVSGPITLSYQTWYDIETDYDYLYLLASTDGEQWQFLFTPSGTAEDPSGNSYGWGYNGQTDGWIQENVDLSEFAGQQVYLRFEYITDAAVNGEGLLLDDVTIEAIDYFTDFEADDGGWQAEGFVRVNNELPQTFQLALIYSDGQVEYIPVPPDNVVDIEFEITDQVSDAVLVVMGTTRFTRQAASYQIEFLP